MPRNPAGAPPPEYDAARSYPPSGVPRQAPHQRSGHPDDRGSGVSRADAGRAARRQVSQRRRGRRRVIVFALLVLAALLVGADLIRRGVGVGIAAPDITMAVIPPSAGVSGATRAAPSAEANPSAVASAAPVLALTGAYPRSGPGTWAYAAAKGPVLGTAGSLRSFQVAIETGISEDINAFAGTLDQTLGDQRSWVAGRGYRLQRVPQGSAAEFTIYLATPETARRLCAAAGVDIRVNGQSYTSCRTFGRVIINLSRWHESVPDYVNAKVPLDIYRQYVINHEVGHQLGFNHELCPGAGKPAPVMQTQTLGLRGCTANPWPYIGGRRYSGRLE